MSKGLTAALQRRVYALFLKILSGEDFGEVIYCIFLKVISLSKIAKRQRLLYHT